MITPGRCFTDSNGIDVYHEFIFLSKEHICRGSGYDVLTFYCKYCLKQVFDRLKSLIELLQETESKLGSLE